MTRRGGASGRGRVSSGRKTAGGARAVAVDALTAFAADPRVRVADLLKPGRLDRRDAALAREIALGAVRRQRLLDHQLGGLTATGLPSHPRTLACLRAGAQQLLFLERVPRHAAVSETVAQAPARQRGFVNAVLRRLADRVHDRPARADELELTPGRALQLTAVLPDPITAPAARLALISGLPDFLVSRWWDRFGASATAQICTAAVRTPAVFLRTVRCTADELATQLRAAGVETAATAHPRVLRWTDGASPFQVDAFRAGRFVVQDPTAVRAAEALGASPGETILDLCAAPGTKTTLLAEAVEPDGRVFAYDVDRQRLASVRENAARLGFGSIGVIHAPGAIDVPLDRILVDVPCSNTGVLGRRVEVRHHLDLAGIHLLVARQRELLADSLARVRRGGTVVYSTCSLEPEENHEVVASVLAGNGQDAELVEESSTLPGWPEHDGGYWAVLRRGPG